MSHDESSEENLEEQDSPEVQFGADIHALAVTAKLIMESGRVAEPMACLLREVRRALRGCAFCREMLGERHRFTCPTGGRTVIFFDLVDPDADVSEDVQPF